MPNTYREPDIIREMAPFKVDGMALPYAEFVPRLYNFCMELGFRKGLIMPSRAFCSDENQGLPIILLTKHFGTFPFNHGRVGGIIAIDRHGPHAHHGEDLVIVQASHVGYDPDSGVYGKYCRPRMIDNCISDSCGKLTHVITPYLEQYQFARERIFLHRGERGRYLITVKNSFIDFDSHPVKDGLVLRLKKVAKVNDDGNIKPVEVYSTSHAFEVSEEFRKRIDAASYDWKANGGDPIGELLTEDLFFYREDFHETDESILLERNLIEFMPQIVTSRNPPLRAAKINIQLEFARAVESIRRGDEYKGRNLLYVAGLNIDISEYGEYPATTYFVPWAAHVQLEKGTPKEYFHPIEQDAIFNKIMAQSIENPDQANLKEEIGRMLEAPRFDIRSPK
ncbi:MAG: hypothetical protein ABR523_07660 [Desulfurivibrionaceae bacterium]